MNDKIKRCKEAIKFIKDNQNERKYYLEQTELGKEALQDLINFANEALDELTKLREEVFNKSEEL